jgi:hypothetical protein
MGSRGPIPKRSNVRRRTNSDEGPITSTPSVVSETAVAPEADATWHPVAIDWYNSLSKSGQSYWYEPSDWATAVYIAEAMSRSLWSEKGMSGQLFASVMAAMNELLTTEGARRRARMEIEREESKDDADVTAIDDYRRTLGA